MLWPLSSSASILTKYGAYVRGHPTSGRLAWVPRTGIISGMNQGMKMTLVMFGILLVTLYALLTKFGADGWTLKP